MALVNFDFVNTAAMSVLPSLLRRWLPGGRIEGCEYVAKNPMRADRKPGSFKINIHNGKWSDFATGDVGGDVVSLAAYLSGTGQVEAARNLSKMMGINHV